MSHDASDAVPVHHSHRHLEFVIRHFGSPCADIREVGGRAKDDRIRGEHLLQARIEGSVLLAAPRILGIETVVTGFAAADVGPADLDELGFPTGRSQRCDYFLQEDFRIPALALASIDGNGFHGLHIV